MNTQERTLFYYQCKRYLSGSAPQTPRETLLELAESIGPETMPDIYGQGEYLQEFETEIAELLEKEAAVFMISGTMAQQCALRIWADRKGCRNVAMHPLGHLEKHEDNAYHFMHNLNGILVGSSEHLITLEDLQNIKDPLFALLLELPQRELGGQLPDWDTLVTMTDWAREKGLINHLDGARLWESTPFYKKSLAEITGLFDSVYVSFYKGLDGLSGSALAGPKDLIDEAKIWQHRHGGTLLRQFPYVISARNGLQKKLSKMQTYYHQTLAFAEVLGTFPQLTINPDPPHTNMMHVYVRGDKQKLEAKAQKIGEEEGVFMFFGLRDTAVPGCYMFEITVKDAGLEWTQEEVQELFDRWLNE
ncbi:MAG: low specificity L-threonine aldolase [Anaerolineaceae bacterium]|nr:low specificity L-threonine aldolase [Anaerolineaceae bacterium]